MLGILLARLLSLSNNERIQNVWRIGKLLALSKDAPTPTPTRDDLDCRPITNSDLFTKLLGLICISQGTFELHPIQRGVRHPGGCHQAVVEVQSAYDSNPSHVVATFDVKNAFNEVSRESIKRKLDSIGATAHYLLKYFILMYGSASPIYIRAKDQYHLFLSSSGVRQGDMPGSLLFSLVFTDAAFNAHTSDMGPITKTLWLYLDDTTIVMTVQDIIRYKVRLITELQKINLVLNMKKCRVLADRCSQSDRELLIAEGFQLDFGSTRVLGCPIGSLSACNDYCLKKVQSYDSFWTRVTNSKLHPATALIIVRLCGQAKFAHLAKALPPSVTNSASRIFDSDVYSALIRILGVRVRTPETLEDKSQTRSIS